MRRGQASLSVVPSQLAFTLVASEGIVVTFEEGARNGRPTPVHGME
jgi:hypothetical protein